MNALQPVTPLRHLPWIRWIDGSELPSIAVGIALLLVFAPFYSWRGTMPQMPMQGGGFVPALAMVLMFLLGLTRGARRDLITLIQAEKIDAGRLSELAAGPLAGKIELGVGLAIGLERTLSQLRFAGHGELDFGLLSEPGALAVCISILFYTVVQIHLLAFCVRQFIVYRRIAGEFKVDLLSPELNNVLSNPFIRFVALGFIATSLGLILHELVPYASQQRRVMQGAALGTVAGLALVAASMIPLVILRRRIAAAKSLEINLIRLALKGDTSGAVRSQFGGRLAQFAPADLMYYEDRIRNIWEWPFEAHVRRLVILGLLPPLTWVLAAAVEVVFEGLIG